MEWRGRGNLVEPLQFPFDLTDLRPRLALAEQDMEEIYQMLHQALSSARASTPEKRQKVYGRAREMVRNEMSRREPIPDAAEIAQIYRSLEGEIARIEIQLTEPPNAKTAEPRAENPMPAEDRTPPKNERAATPAAAAVNGRGRGRIWLLGVICGVAGYWGYLRWQQTNHEVEVELPVLSTDQLKSEEDAAIERVVDKIEGAQGGL